MGMLPICRAEACLRRVIMGLSVSMLIARSDNCPALSVPALRCWIRTILYKI